MRARLQKYLPIFLIALLVQILAPIGVCWAAAIAASDPLGTAEICHDSGSGAAGQQNEQSGRPRLCLFDLLPCQRQRLHRHANAGGLGESVSRARPHGLAQSGARPVAFVYRLQRAKPGSAASILTELEPSGTALAGAGRRVFRGGH
jgi:hypothetical protein